jgi:hypothetical protein
VTDDGYILTLHRIPSSKGKAQKPPVLLQHGLLCSSADWVISGPGDGLGKRTYIFTELLGFWTFSVVWYSREHDVSETGSVSVFR